MAGRDLTATFIACTLRASLPSRSSLSSSGYPLDSMRGAPWFIREATEAPVPLDLRALRSPFEIDIYVWLT